MVAGFTVFDWDRRTAEWADAAWTVASEIGIKPDRCGGTWHVGVDALPNEPDGSIMGVPLRGPWDLDWDEWHRAQLSVIYPGYPRQDKGESDAAFRFRVERFAAHMDGLLPEGPARRRHLREPHAFILGLPLTAVVESPLVVWPRSHTIMGAAFERALAGFDPDDWGEIDVTDIYQAARREVFERCTPEPVVMGPGQAVLLHRHLIHGVAPWEGSKEMFRMVAYFRPQFSNVGDWL